MTELAEKRDAEHGYRTVGAKAFNLARWAERKDRREFAALVNRLSALRWQRGVYAAGGERLLRLRARKLEWWRATKGRRLAQRRGRVVTCRCGASWCHVPTSVGRPLTHCSHRCERAASWARTSDRRQRKLCRGGCGRPKLDGQGQRYCARCPRGAAQERRRARRGAI